MTRAIRAAAVVAAVAYLLVVGLLTLGPTLWRTGPTNANYDVLSPSTWGDASTWSDLGSGEFVANILLFVPLGFLLRVSFPRGTWVGATAAAAGLSLAIELLQMLTSRVSDPRDILANTIGALVGALIAAIFASIRRVLRPVRPRELERVR